MAAYMVKILELTPFFFNGGSDPRNVKLQDKMLVGGDFKNDNQFSFGYWSLISPVLKLSRTLEFYGLNVSSRLNRTDL